MPLIRVNLPEVISINEMDPISQAVVGVTAAKSQNISNTLLVILIAASAGMAPDLDILINSDKNPLLSVAYHRHFTHSFILIPHKALSLFGINAYLISEIILFFLSKETYSLENQMNFFTS